MEQMYRRKKKSKIAPSSEDDSRLGLENVAFEMDSVKSNQLYNKFQNGVQAQVNTIRALTAAKEGISRWQAYANKRRSIRQSNSTEDAMEKTQAGGIGLGDIHDNFTMKGEITISADVKTGKDINMAVASNRALMQYFAKLGQANHDDEYVNLDFIESLLNSGANINCMDKYGQTILHEVARAWHVDVGRFLLEHGADVNKPDVYGRTPLHVASAVDYPEMVNLLIEFKADKEAKTSGEEQTPVHYAAKNDACSSLKALAKCGCDIKHVRDYKGRTPIHVAAELDRSESARLLLSLGAPINVTDNQGQQTITLMITKMAPVAHEALNQFRSIDRANRKQFVYLNHLVRNPFLHEESMAQSPLLVSVNHRQYQLIMHPVFERLIDVMWSKFGAIGAWKNLILNFVYILLWTVIGVVVEYDDRHKYTLPDDWWRIVLLICAVGFSVWQVVEELRDYGRSKTSHRKWKAWRESEIAKDKEFCHPRWPEEEAFLNRELEMLKEVDQSYFSDMWNVFDWTCYFLLTVCVATHIADVFAHSEHLARWHVRFMCFTIIILWLRLMKDARAFTLLGPFIVMLGHMLKDLLRFVFLYLEFYIPYVCAFWIIFGGNKRAEVDIGNPDAGETIVVSGYEYPGQVLFSIFRLTLVDDYDFDNMYLVDSVMATLLVWSWLAVSSILCLNLFIALLSDTFQRIYDNAQANSVMQRAITILTFWEKMSNKRKLKFLKYIKDECSPMKDYYDDDLTESGEEDIKKVTIQIKEQLDQIHDSWKFHFGDADDQPNDPQEILKQPGSTGKKTANVVTNKKFDAEVSRIHEMIGELKDQQDVMVTTFKHDLKAVKQMLKELTGRKPMAPVEETSVRQDPQIMGSGWSDPAGPSRGLAFARPNMLGTAGTSQESLYPPSGRPNNEVEVVTARFTTSDFPDLPRHDSQA